MRIAILEYAGSGKTYISNYISYKEINYITGEILCLYLQ